MALPTTISGISTSIACVGPFFNGNVYFFGRDGTTATTLQAYKATDPTSSFSSVATKTGFTTGVQYSAGYQVLDVIHMIVIDGATTSVNAQYQTFSMSSDSFVTAETIASGFNPETSGSAPTYFGSLVVRSGGEVVAFFNGARTKKSGTSYSRVYYSRRTGVNTWTAAVQVDDGSANDFLAMGLLLGASDRVHIWYSNGGAFGANSVLHRALSSANVLQTATTKTLGFYGYGVAYNNSGTVKIVMPAGVGGATVDALYFDSSDTPTINQSSGFSAGVPAVMYNDNTDVWIVGVNAVFDLIALKSTDDGATWGSSANIFTGTINNTENSFSHSGNIFTRGKNVVIPYVVNDNGTLKYNEYTVRTIPDIISKATVKSQAVRRAAFW